MKYLLNLARLEGSTREEAGMKIEEKVEVGHQPVVREAVGGKWRKRRLVAEFSVLSLVLGLAWFNRPGHGRIWIDSESCGFELYRGGYRNWEIVWSDGYSLQRDGTIKHFWRSPTFRHADLRPYTTNVPAEFR